MMQMPWNRSEPTSEPKRKHLTCNCAGGRLWPVRDHLPRSIVFPLTWQTGGVTEEEKIVHRGNNPHAWGEALLYECEVCRNVYAVAPRDFSLQDRKGSRTVAKGAVVRLTADHVEELKAQHRQFAGRAGLEAEDGSAGPAPHDDAKDGE